MDTEMILNAHIRSTEQTDIDEYVSILTAYHGINIDAVHITH